MKRNRKWKIPPTILERRTLCFRSYKNHKLKSKTVVSWTSPKKKEGIFCTVYFFKICALSQCIVYWIHFQNIHTFTYQKTLLYTFLLLVFKVLEIFQCVFKILLKQLLQVSVALSKDVWSYVKKSISFRRHGFFISNTPQLSLRVA